MKFLKYMSLQYHIDNTECMCKYGHPIVSCLHCELKEIQKAAKELLEAGVSRPRMGGAWHEYTEEAKKMRGLL